MSAGVPLTEDFDPNAVIRAIPDDYVRKGLLFVRHAAALGDELRSLPLERPPGPEGYAALETYPARDYFRILDRVAERAHPGVARAQRWRLAGRTELQSFMAHTMGQVELVSFNNPTEALLRYQQIAPFVLNKPRATTMVLPRQGVRVEYIDPLVSIPYGAGVFEGVVMTFGLHPRVAIEQRGDVTVFDVRWGL